MAESNIEKANRRRREGLERVAKEKEKRGLDSSRERAELASSGSRGGRSSGGRSVQTRTITEIAKEPVASKEGGGTISRGDALNEPVASSVGGGVIRKAEAQRQQEEARTRATRDGAIKESSESSANTYIERRARNILERGKQSQERSEEQLRRFGLQNLEVNELDSNFKKTAKYLGQSVYSVTLGFPTTAERLASTVDKGIFRAQLEYYNLKGKLDEDKKRALKNERKSATRSLFESISPIRTDEAGTLQYNPTGTANLITSGLFAGANTISIYGKSTVKPNPYRAKPTRPPLLSSKRAQKTTVQRIPRGTITTRTVRTGLGKIRQSTTRKNLPANKGQVITERKISFTPKGQPTTPKSSRLYPKNYGSQRVQKSTQQPNYIISRNTQAGYNQRYQTQLMEKAKQIDTPLTTPQKTTPAKTRSQGQSYTLVNIPKQSRGALNSQQRPTTTPQQAQRGTPSPRDALARERLSNLLAQRRAQLAQEKMPLQNTFNPQKSTPFRILFNQLDSRSIKAPPNPTVKLRIVESDTVFTNIPRSNTVLPLTTPITNIDISTDAIISNEQNLEQLLPPISGELFKQSQQPTQRQSPLQKQTPDTDTPQQQELKPIQPQPLLISKPSRNRDKRPRDTPPTQIRTPDKTTPIYPQKPPTPPQKTTPATTTSLFRLPPPPPIRANLQTPRSYRFSAGFDVFARIGGVFKRVNTQALPRNLALQLGKTRTEETALASFKILPAGRIKPRADARTPDLSNFYKNKSGVFVERKEKRINTPGELREITAKGIRANRGIFRRRKQ